MRGILISGATAFLLSFLLTPVFIKFLSRKGYGQQIRDDGPKTHHTKRGTPTMGGVILILAAIAGYLITQFNHSFALSKLSTQHLDSKTIHRTRSNQALLT